MYVHGFAFRWQPGTTDEQKARAEKEILELQGRIPGLLETHVGRNISPRGKGYGFAGFMKFADRQSMDAYNEHPAHVALVQWLMPLVEPVELDFEAVSATNKPVATA